MSKRVLPWCLSGRHALSLLQRDAHTVNSLASAAQACQPLSTLATSAKDPTLRPSTSAPSLPPSLRELQATLRAPRSSLLSALDKQVAGTADADAAALDDDLVRHLLRSNSAAAHGEALDTLRLLRRSNAGLPGLRGQTILAKVLNVNAKRILVDPGFTALSEVPRDEVSIAHVHTSDGQLPDGRLSTSDIRPGDLLRLRVDCVYTPYGDMQLTAVKGDVEQQRRLIWGELRRAMEQRRPVAGRVLNECPGGFAVGVAGFVAVLPAALAATATTRAVGVAQEFTIMAMDDARQRITLRDPRLQRLSR